MDLDIGISAADLSVLRHSVAELRLLPAGPAASTTAAAAASTSIRSSLSSLPDEEITTSSAHASPLRSPAKARSTTVQFQSEAVLANGGGASSGSTPESVRRAGRPVSAVRRKTTEAGGGDLACDLHAVLQATAAENQRALQQAPSASADSSTSTSDAAVAQRQSAPPPPPEAAAAAAVAPAVAPLASVEVNAAREAQREADRAPPGPSAAAAGDGAGG